MKATATATATTTKLRVINIDSVQGLSVVKDVEHDDEVSVDSVLPAARS